MDLLDQLTQLNLQTDHLLEQNTEEDYYSNAHLMNDLSAQRAVLFTQMHPHSYFGNFYLYPERKIDRYLVSHGAAGSASSYRFIVPAYDNQLAGLCDLLNNCSTEAEVATTIVLIANRIEELGGIYLFWI